MGTLKEELMIIYRDHGQLTPDLVVQVATPVDHPLHHRFKWDDAVAADLYRQQQAQELIRSVRLEVVYIEGNKRPTSVRAFQSVPTAQGYQYKPTEEIAKDPLLRQMTLNTMEREWRAMLARYEQFAEFASMVVADMERLASV